MEWIKNSNKEKHNNKENKKEKNKINEKKVNKNNEPYICDIPDNFEEKPEYL